MGVEPEDDRDRETRARERGAGKTRRRSERPRTVPDLAVWAVVALATLVGLLTALSGLVMLAFGDRTRIESLLAAENVQVEGLTEPQAADLLVSLFWWGGIGLVVGGLLLVAAGLGFLVYQRRVARRRDVEGVGAATGWTAAILGAVVTILTSFVPFSPVLGGGVAGYVRRGSRERGAIVGGLSGVLSALPPLIVMGFFTVGLAAGWPGPADVGGPLLIAALAGLAALFLLVVAAALGGVGGVVGNYVAEERSDRESSIVED